MIMSDVKAANTTFIEYSMRWWMFTSIAGAGSSTPDELHLFYTDDPLSDWTPHPMNPIVSDVRSAQTAGRLFRREGGLIRPSRDPSLRHGHAVSLNSITTLTIYEYQEELLERIEPPDEDILAVQTYNQSDDLVVVDVLPNR